MEYFAGLDVSMAETQICVIARSGAVIHKAKVPSTPADIAAELAEVPACQRILFETGRMAPMLYHGLRKLGLPVVCVESRQAYQALKLLATHKTDHNDARGLAHLARTGFQGREQCRMRPPGPTAISTKPPCTQLTPSSAMRARREHRHPTTSPSKSSCCP